MFFLIFIPLWSVRSLSLFFGPMLFFLLYFQSCVFALRPQLQWSCLDPFYVVKAYFCLPIFRFTSPQSFFTTPLILPAPLRSPSSGEISLTFPRFFPLLSSFFSFGVIQCSFFWTSGYVICRVVCFCLPFDAMEVLWAPTFRVSLVFLASVLDRSFFCSRAPSLIAQLESFACFKYQT